MELSENEADLINRIRANPNFAALILGLQIALDEAYIRGAKDILSDDL